MNTESEIINKLRLQGITVSIVYPPCLHSLIQIKLDVPSGKLQKKLVQVEAPLLAIALEEALKILEAGK